MPRGRGRRNQEESSSRADRGDGGRGLRGQFERLLRTLVERTPAAPAPLPRREIKKKEVAEAGAYTFASAKGPLDAITWMDRVERAFRFTELPENRKVWMATSFLDDTAYHWWMSVSGNRQGAPEVTWAEFKALFNEKYLGHAQRSRLHFDFLNMRKRDDESVVEFEQRFTTMSYHVSHLVPDERSKIEMFINGLGGVFTDKMTGIVYPSFVDTVGAAIAIETRRASAIRSRDFGGPSQGPAKRVSSSSGSGSSVGSGQSSGSSSNWRNRSRGRFKGARRNQMGRQQSGQFRTDVSVQGESSAGQPSSFGQQQPAGCFECGSMDHFSN